MNQLLTTKNQQRGANRRVTRNKAPVTRLIANQPPPYTPDKVLRYKIRYVPSTADYFWTLPIQQSPFGFASSGINIYNLCRYVRLAKVRMTLLYDPDESLNSNWISLKFQQNAGQNGVIGTEMVRYASQVQPGVIEVTLSRDDPRGYFYDVQASSGNPSLLMQTRKNCFIDLTWEVILYDGLSDTNATAGATAFYLYTNQFAADITCPGRQTAIW